jgi:hypothetical protein
MRERPDTLHPNRFTNHRNGFHDWFGTAAVQVDISRGQCLEGLAGLNPQDWIAVGLVVVPACRNRTQDEIYLDVVDLRSIDISPTGDVVRELMSSADTRRALPVTRIQLTGMDLQELLSYMTGGILHLRAAGIDHAELVITKHDRRAVIIE